MKKKKLTGKALTRALDNAIRKLYKLKYPNPACFVCGNEHGWYGSDNRTGCQIGHYVSRRYHALRWDEKNIWPQGAGCNVTHNVNPIPFTQKILKEYGQERLDYLEKKMRDHERLGVLDKRKILENLQKKIKSLQDN